jgi:SAM-dependent methyltransferase
MHDTAFQIAAKFFQLYWKAGNRLIVELGACSINGSLREHQPPGSKYVGLDITAGPSVDVVIENSLHLPFADCEADCVLSSSTFEHDRFFWQTFLELCRITKPGGFVYLNSPSNGEFHRYPSDYWRFYPDAGLGLEDWARTSGIQVTLVESFVAARIDDQWNDFVAIFQRGEAEPRRDDEFLSNHFACQNVHRFNTPEIVAFESRTQDMQLLASARASGQRDTSLNKQLSDLQEQVSRLSEVSIQHDALQQAHIILQNKDENNARLLAAREDALNALKATMAQAIGGREYERERAEKLSASVQELTLQMHSIQEVALGTVRDFVARERDMAERLAAKDHELNAHLLTSKQELLDAARRAATRERELLEQFLSRERAVEIQLTSLRSESALLSRGIVTREATISTLSEAAQASSRKIDALEERVRSVSLIAADSEVSSLNTAIAHIADLIGELGEVYGTAFWRPAALPRRLRGASFGAKTLGSGFAAAGPSANTSSAASGNARTRSIERPLGNKMSNSLATRMYRHGEPVAAATDFVELLQENEQQFIERTYQTFLKRSPDSQGLMYYLERLMNGAPKVQILAEVCGSDEARQLGIDLPGLTRAIGLYRLVNVPILGAAARLFVNADRNTSFENELRAIQQQLWASHRHLVEHLIQIETNVERMRRAISGVQDSLG